MGHLTQGNMCIDSYLLGSVCLDDSKEGWASYRSGDNWGSLRQKPSVPVPHFLALVLGLRPPGELE